MPVKPITFSIDGELLRLIDERAASLGLTRSGYLAMVARQDLAKGGPMLIHEIAETKPATVPPKLTHYPRAKKSRAADPVEAARAGILRSEIAASKKSSHQ